MKSGPRASMYVAIVSPRTAPCDRVSTLCCHAAVLQTRSSKSKIRRAVRRWAPRWQVVANSLCGQTWLGAYPQVFAAMQVDESPDDNGTFAGLHFVNLDGKVFSCDQSRLNNAVKRALYSAKTKSSGLQALVWSMPCGTPILVRDDTATFAPAWARLLLC